MLSLLPRGTSSMDCRTVLPNISTLRVEEDRFRHGNKCRTNLTESRPCPMQRQPATNVLLVMAPALD